MSRTLILTPYEHGYLAALDHHFNKGPFSVKNNEIDIPHVLLSALTMSGVDSILSMGNLTISKTTLVKKITSAASVKKWSKVYKKSENIIDVYKTNIKEKNTLEDLDELKHKLSQLLFSLKTNSGIISFSSFTEIKNKERLPLDLAVPLEILMNSVQIKSANLPIIKFETDFHNNFIILKIS